MSVNKIKNAADLGSSAPNISLQYVYDPTAGGTWREMKTTDYSNVVIDSVDIHLEKENDSVAIAGSDDNGTTMRLIKTDTLGRPILGPSDQEIGKLAAGTANIGKVELAASTANIGKVELAASTANIGKVELAASTASIGKVELAAGTAEIGTVNARSITGASTWLAATTGTNIPTPGAGNAIYITYMQSQSGEAGALETGLTITLGTDETIAPAIPIKAETNAAVKVIQAKVLYYTGPA